MESSPLLILTHFFAPSEIKSSLIFEIILYLIPWTLTNFIIYVRAVNNGPISLTPLCVKVLEAITHSEVTFLIDKVFLYGVQLGFSSKKSFFANLLSTFGK